MWNNMQNIKRNNQSEDLHSKEGKLKVLLNNKFN